MNSYNFSESVLNGFNSLISNGVVTLNGYNELQAVADMAKDLGHGINWNTPTGTLSIV